MDWLTNNILSILNLAALILLSLFGKNWVNKKKSEIEKSMNKELEEIKSALSKEQLIHKLQFEKEFDIYEKLWARLIIFENVTRRYIAILSFFEPKKDLDETQKKMLQKYNGAFGDIEKTISISKPFYSVQVYKYTDELLNAAHSKVISSQFISYEKEPKKYLNEFKKYNKEIKKIIDNIEEAIRERIRNIGEAKLIE